MAAWRTVRLMPERAAAAVFRAGADRAAARNGAGVQRLAANLRVVVGPDLPEEELKLLVRDGMRSYARYWMEAFRLPSKSQEQHLEYFRLRDNHLLLDNHAAGRGCVLALSHSGNWDAAGAWVCASGMPLTTVAERLKPEAVYQRFVAYRESLGMEILPLTGGGRPLMDVLAERANNGAVVPLLADRDFSTRGIQVDFFGRKTRMPGGPAILALRTGVPLFVVPIWYEDDHLAGDVVPVPMPDPASGSLDERVRVVTQRMADHFAESIAAHPADWHMLAPMFRPERERRPGGGDQAGTADRTDRPDRASAGEQAGAGAVAD
jgi:KDO2-lipid IV(A) lauroyltransferase